jgi:hypothetical protein
MSKTLFLVPPVSSEKNKEKICLMCGNLFYVESYRFNKAKYCGFKCSGMATKNRLRGVSPNWKGGRARHTNGYMYIVCRDHPNKVTGQYVLEHRLVCEKTIGRFLEKSEVVHHVNGIKDDNRIQNLMVFSSDSAHNRFERGFKITEGELVFDGRSHE